MRPFLSLLFIFIFFISCNDNKVQTTQAKPTENTNKINWITPAPGKVIAEYKEPITEDKLNNSYFLVLVKSTDESKKGLFDLVLGYGENINTTTLELPKWSDKTNLKPIIRKGEKPFECYIGFQAGDTTFNELYKVWIEDKNIRLKQTKAYSLQNY